MLKLTEKLTAVRSELLTQKRILYDIINDLVREKPKRRLGRQELFLRSSETNDKLIEKLENRVRELESQQKELIAEVLKVKRFKEGLEKLRAEAKREFIESEERLEQKESDERTTVGFTRKIQKARSVGKSMV